jgi:hypothetical protein
VAEFENEINGARHRCGAGCRALTGGDTPRPATLADAELAGVRFCARLKFFKLLGSFFCNLNKTCAGER